MKLKTIVPMMKLKTIVPMMKLKNDSSDDEIENDSSDDEIQIRNHTVDSLMESSSRPGERCNDGLSLKSFSPHSSQKNVTVDLKLECNDIQHEDCPKNECKLCLLHFSILCITTDLYN